MHQLVDMLVTEKQLFNLAAPLLAPTLTTSLRKTAQGRSLE